MVTGGGNLISAKVSAAIAYGRAKSNIDVKFLGNADLGGIRSRNNAQDLVASTISNSSFAAISAAARFGAAYTQDRFTTSITVNGAETNIGKKGVDIQTVYTMTTDAEVTPSTTGVDVSLASLAINAAIAKNTAMANAAFEAIEGVATVDGGDVVIKAVGTAAVNARVNSAHFTISALSLGASIAKADLSVTQEAHLRVGGTFDVKAETEKDESGSVKLDEKGNPVKTGNGGKVDVQSIANMATANAIIAANEGDSGLDKNEMKLAVANLDVSKAIARENMANSAVVLGGSTSSIEGTEKVDKGGFVTTEVGRFDLELVMDGMHIVRDENGKPYTETVHVVLYDTGEEVRYNGAAKPEIFSDTRVEENDDIREILDEYDEEDYMYRSGEYNPWVVETV